MKKLQWKNKLTKSKKLKFYRLYQIKIKAAKKIGILVWLNKMCKIQDVNIKSKITNSTFDSILHIIALQPIGDKNIDKLNC